MTHYQSAKKVHNAMKKLSDDSYLAAPGKAGKNPDENWSDVDEVEVRTKENGTTVFEVKEVLLGQMNSLRLEKDGVELVIDCNLSPRGKYDSPAKIRRDDVSYAEAERDQVMEVTPA